ncbi:MAG: hypothetical protein ACK6EB_46975, partial [Planctomyces sp.]
MKFANIMRSAAAATARPTTLMLQLHNNTQLRDFAASRAKNALNVYLTRRREDAKDSHEICTHHAFCRGSYG